MDFKILEHKEILGHDGNKLHLYKIIFNGQKIWINPSKFDKGLMEVKGQIITIKESLEVYYYIEDRINKNGKFKVLLPKPNGSSEIVSEPAVAYKTSPKISDKSDNIEKYFLKLKDRDKLYNVNESADDSKKINIIPKSSKTDFIKEILSRKQVSHQNLKRIIELGAIGGVEELMKEIDTIKSRLEAVKIDSNKSEKRDKQKFHDPPLVGKLLSKFRYDNNLKWNCHTWDNIEFESMDGYFSAVQNHYKEFSKLTSYCPDLYWKLIYPFIFQKKLSVSKNGEHIPYRWGQYDLKVGWQYPIDLVKNWTEKNYFNQPKAYRMLPFEMEIPKELCPTDRINQKTIKYFGEVTELFKKEIEFRTNELYYAVDKLVKQELSDFNVLQDDLAHLKNKEFYTYTSKVLDGLRAIFQMIKTRSEFPTVRIGINLSESDLNIEIIHVDSFDNKTLNHNHKLLQSNSGQYGGDLGKAVAAFYSLCDFEIESVFKDNQGKKLSAGIKFLYDTDNKTCSSPKIEENLKHDILGFKYRLIFPLQKQE